MMLRKISLLACALGLAVSAAAATTAATDSGTLTRAETLRDKPFADARAVTTAASGAKVEIVTRNGAWYQVKTAGKTGWVRMLSVRRSAAASGSSISGLANVASGRTGTGKVTTTTGVRGLDSDDLAAASFDEAQTAKAEGYRVSRKDAEAFAKQGKLSLRDVQPLPAPAKK
jgi:uncharacterized protein YgiM (DUF1202 family)